jgi:TorA maturation chaperone TorD
MNESMQSEIARAQMYRLLARLFLSEPDEETLSTVTRESVLAVTLPGNLHNLRVEFTRLFMLNVYPYASFFLDAQAALHTETTARIQTAYERANFQLDFALPIAAPDHFGAELLFMAHLLETQRADDANRFLCDEVLSWAGIFLCAVEKNAREEFYQTIAIQTHTWLIHDLELHDPQAIFHFSLPSTLDKEESLEAIVVRLISPARSGIFLSKDDIARLARLVELPISFGDRALMLKSLFRAAGEYSHVRDLLHALQTETHAWVEFYAGSARENIILAPIALAWINCARATFDLIVRMIRDVEKT